MSAVRLSRAYLPGMQNVDWGRVIFIASESGFNIPVEMIHYGVSKTADIAVARGLAKRMAGTGVTVNSVLPGNRQYSPSVLVSHSPVPCSFPPCEFKLNRDLRASRG